MRRAVGNAARGSLIALVLAYGGDWSTFRFRLAHGTGMGSVQVEQFLKTPLKGNKMEYDYLGSASASCSQTLFPQYGAAAWNTPCWWLRWRRTQWQ